jgi:hypothetical protein
MDPGSHLVFFSEFPGKKIKLLTARTTLINIKPGYGAFWSSGRGCLPEGFSRRIADLAVPVGRQPD